MKIFQYLGFVLLVSLSSPSFSEEVDLFSLISNIHGNPEIEQAAICLGADPYKLSIEIQEAILTCGKSLSHSKARSWIDKLGSCVKHRIGESYPSLSSAEKEHCYPSNILNKIADEEIESLAAADALGEQLLDKIFMPKNACKIAMSNNEYLHMAENEIYVQAGTTLPILNAGGDSFDILVGMSNLEIAEGPIEYKSKDCPKEFIKAISAYDLEESSDFDTEEFATKMLSISRSPNGKDSVCSLNYGQSLKDALYTMREVYLDGHNSNDAIVEIEFDVDSKLCAGKQGYVDSNYIVSFVVKPDLGFLKKESDLPQCSKKVDGLSVFVEKTSLGPDLLRCSYSTSQKKGEWIGKQL